MATEGGVMKNLRSVIVFLFVAFLSAAPAWAQRFDPPGLDRALAAQAHYTDDLLQVPGVAGTAVGVGADGQAVVKIYAEKSGIGGLPQELDGVPVDVQVTGKIQALARKPGGGGGGGVNPQGTFTQPVPLGVSSGSVRSIQESGIFITCTSGTLGARLSDGSNYYALSNNHVYAVTNLGQTGDAIVQPGPADTNCVPNTTNTIGTLSKYVTIDFSSGNNNTVDAAIALSSDGQVGNTYWDGVTVQGSTPVLSPNVGDAVRKYGAVSKLTTGKIAAINATLSVNYGNGQVANFTGQIEFSGCKGACIKSGDSGSVLITNDSAHNPVGLLFAGDQTGKFAWANPIDDVLSQLGAALGKTLVFQ
jgi:hypothetical protein